MIATLRGLIRGVAPDAPLALVDLARRMRTCRCGVVFFGLGLSMCGLGHRSVEALLLLVSELNNHTRFYARRLRVQGDVTGADSVLAWQTGYPFSVNLSRGYPRFNPGEFSAVDQLERGEPDTCLLVGTETLDRFPERALAHLRRIPTIVLDYPGAAPPFTPTVRFTTAIYGLHRPGTVYRMDEVPIPLRQVLDSPLASDAEILDGILARLRP